MVVFCPDKADETFTFVGGNTVIFLGGPLGLLPNISTVCLCTEMESFFLGVEFDQFNCLVISAVKEV